MRTDWLFWQMSSSDKDYLMLLARVWLTVDWLGQTGLRTANGTQRTKCNGYIDRPLTGDLSLPEGERYHHVERSEAAAVNGGAARLV